MPIAGVVPRVRTQTPTERWARTQPSVASPGWDGSPFMTISTLNPLGADDDPGLRNECMQSALRVGAVWLLASASLVGAVQLGFENESSFDTLLDRLRTELAERPPLTQALVEQGSPDTGRLMTLERRLPDALALAQAGEEGSSRAHALWLASAAELQRAGWPSPSPEEWWAELEALSRSPEELDWLVAPEPLLDPWPAVRARAGETAANLLAEWAGRARAASLRQRLQFERALIEELRGNTDEADSIRADLVAAAPNDPWGRRAARARSAARRWTVGRPVLDPELRDLDGNAISITAAAGGHVVLACLTDPDASTLELLGSAARSRGPRGLHVVIVATADTRAAWRRATESFVNVLDVADGFALPRELTAFEGPSYFLLDSDRTLLARATELGPLLGQIATEPDPSSRSTQR